MTVSQQYWHRFGGIARLYGVGAVEALAHSHFAVVGLGGVGSWCAEALARSGVGALTLIDMDEVCVTNSNRQLPAMSSTVGKSKIAVLSARLRDINPDLRIELIEDFLATDNAPELIDPELDGVVDAIDTARIKAALVAYCSRLKMRLVTVGSSGGKRDPSRVTWADLALTTQDPLLARVRRHLYEQHQFARSHNPKKRRFRVDAIYSTEAMVYPKPDGSVCQSRTALQDGVRLDCAGGFGSATMITGSFGFLAASRAIERYLQSV